MEAVKLKSTELLRIFSEHDMHHRFERWKFYIQRYRNGEQNIEGVEIAVVKFDK